MQPDLERYGLVPLADLPAEELARCAIGVPVTYRVRGRNGRIRAFAMVDQADYSWARRHFWRLNPQGYVVRNISQAGGVHGLARQVMGLGKGDGRCVDHIDHDLLNNRRSNLRAVTHAENHQNRRVGGDRGTSSRHRGVSFSRGSGWVAYATVAGRQHWLGRFDDEDEAGRVATEFRRAHMPYSTN